MRKIKFESKVTTMPNKPSAQAINQNLANFVKQLKLDAATKQATDLLTMAVQASQQDGGVASLSINTDSVTPGASMTSRVQRILDVGATLGAKDTTEDNVQVVINNFSYRLMAISTKPFVLLPFLILLENGETLTDTDGTESNALVAINTAESGAHYSLKVAPDFMEGNHFKENGNDYWKASGTIDITKQSNIWLRKYFYRLGLLEQSKPVLELGYYYFTGTATTSVTVYRKGFISYYTKENKAISL